MSDIIIFKNRFSYNLLTEFINNIKSTPIDQHLIICQQLKNTLCLFCNKWSVDKTIILLYSILFKFPIVLCQIIANYTAGYLSPNEYFTKTIKDMNESYFVDENSIAISQELINNLFILYPIVYYSKINTFIDIRLHNPITKQIIILVSDSNKNMNMYSIYTENEFEIDINVLYQQQHAIPYNQ